MDLILFERSSAYSFFDGYESPINKIYKEFAESFMNYAGYKGVKVFFEIVRNPMLNATLKMEKNNIIKMRLTEGAITKIYSFFYDMNICCDICEYGFECDKLDHVGTKVILGDDKGRENEVILRLCKDKRVNAIAEYMSMFAIKFIILHEFGHYLNGHCGYAIYNGRDDYEFSLRKGIHNELSSLQSCALESDADCFAACYLISEIETLYNQKDFIFSILKDKTDVYKLLIASIQGVFCLIEEEQIKDDTHPLPASRGITCINGAVRLVSQLCFQKEVEETIVSVWRFANTLNDLSIEEWASRLKNYCVEAQRIEDCWREEMYYKVKPFALANISNM